MSKPKIFTLLVGGPAGAGARSAGLNLGRLLNQCGYEVFVSVEYPSLIRGGHNLCRVSFSSQPVKTGYYDLDAIVATDKKSIALHKKELKAGGLIVFDSTGAEPVPGAVNVPAAEMAKKKKAPAIMEAAPLVGAMCYQLGLNFNKLVSVYKAAFGGKAGLNIDLAKKGYETAKKQGIKPMKLPAPLKSSLKKEVIDGSVALVEGMAQAGLDFYIAYPMTPSTPMLHYAAKHKKRLKTRVIQAENEISVANMAVGVIFAGKKAAVGTSGGGFALMMETMSLAGIGELPMVAIDAQRMGPATGVATRQAQGDLSFVRNIPGEYPRIILAPGDPEEAYLLGNRALELAWQFQTPTIILTDKHLAESFVSSGLPKKQAKKTIIKTVNQGASYRRYKITPSGVSPLAFPGAPQATVKVNSYEHTEDGLTTEEPVMVEKMYNKRFAKLKSIKSALKKYPTIKIYGDKKSRQAVIFWGSTKGAVLEALKHTKKPFKAIQVLFLEPLDEATLKRELKGVKKIVTAENNYSGQMTRLLGEVMKIKADQVITRYNSLAFDPVALAKKIDKIFK